MTHALTASQSLDTRNTACYPDVKTRKRRLTTACVKFINWSNCTATYITAPEARTAKQRTYLYLVELASNQLDYEGVPANYRIVDVVVLENKLSAIKNLIAAAGCKEQFTIVSHWVPDDCDCF